MFACCGRPAAASFCDPFAYIVPTMRAKQSQKSARWGPASRRRPLVRQAPGAFAAGDDDAVQSAGLGPSISAAALSAGLAFFRCFVVTAAGLRQTCITA